LIGLTQPFSHENSCLITLPGVVRILGSKESKPGRKSMQLTRISPKHQITIPKEVFTKLQLEVGDFLEVEATEAGVLLIPKKLISKDQAIERGDLSKPFQKAEELLRHLKKRR
jgi:AbrB family looped-hinge helix DNA binding protein